MTSRRNAIQLATTALVLPVLATGCGFFRQNHPLSMAEYLAKGKLHESEHMPAYVAASIVPYAIGSGTAFDAYPGTDWIERVGEPMFFEAGPRKIDACMLVETKTQILLAVRATELAMPGHAVQSIVDWLNDLKAAPVGSSHTGLVGQLHGGFWGSWNRWMDAGVGPAVIAKVKQTGKPLVLCGYSKGAGVAPIAAMSLLEQGLPAALLEGVVLFEAPRPGDEVFAKAYQAVFGHKTVRYAYKDDVIPHLPPSEEVLGWLNKLPVVGRLLSELYGDISQWTPSPVGNLFFIDWDGKIQPDSQELEKQRSAHLKQLALHLKFKDILWDHLPNAGFVKSLVPDRTCPWNFRLF